MAAADSMWHLTFARSVSRFARDMTPASITLSEDKEHNLVRFWMVGFLIAARRLLEVIVMLHEKDFPGLGRTERSVRRRPCRATH